MKKIFFPLAAIIIGTTFSSCTKEPVSKTLVITGQSEHNWKASYPVLKDILEKSGLFKVDVMITPEKGTDMSAFKPGFSKYKLVVLDYSGDRWSDETSKNFVDYVRNGGGVVVYHGSSISFPDWKEYNEIIGLGGWNGRNEKSGPYVYYSRNQIITDTAAGIAGSHGPRHEFEVRTRVSDHPVTAGLPARWMHGSDELYQQLRGPATNMQILATAFSSPKNSGTGRDEPVLMVLNYGKGRIFHTTLGHADEGGGPAMQCAGFLVTLLRGAEWAATGKVTREVPYDFPTAAGVILRPDFKEITIDDAFSNLGAYDIPKSTKYFTFIQSQIRKAAGDEALLLKLEMRLVDVLKNPDTSAEAKKLILRELSWMGTDYSVTAIKSLTITPDLKDDIEFASDRLK
jgi:type 1 glutamine amidotransferase